MMRLITFQFHDLAEQSRARTFFGGLPVLKPRFFEVAGTTPNISRGGLFSSLA